MTYNDDIVGDQRGFYWVGDPSRRFPYSTKSEEPAARAKARDYRDAEIARRDKLAGHKLTMNEHRRGTIDRPDTRSLVERMADDAWQAKLAPATRYDALVESLRPESKNKAFTAATREQRLYESAKMLRDDEADKQERETAREAHLADPKTAAALAALREIEERARWNPAVTMQEWLEVQRAITQVSTPNGDPAAVKEHLVNVLGREDARSAALRLDAQQELIAVQQRAAELQEALGGEAAA